MFPYRSGFAAYVWITTPYVSVSANTFTDLGIRTLPHQTFVGCSLHDAVDSVPGEASEFSIDLPVAICPHGDGA
jgi:hypothetical protein